MYDIRVLGSNLDFIDRQEAHVKGQILCVLSDVRSGSTLFGQLLGAHTRIVLAGELQWLRAYALDDRQQYNPPHELLCACGRQFGKCEFWQAVSQATNRPLSGLTVIPRFFGWDGPGSVRPRLCKRIPRRIVELRPALFRSRFVRAFFGEQKVIADNMAVFDAILNHTGASYVVDTSKLIFRFRMLYASHPERFKVIVLHRDYRAVVYSQMKRGYSLDESALSWARKVEQIEALSADIPTSNIAQLKYEDLCSDPTAELGRLCQFLGLEFEAAMLTRPTIGVHDIGGSPSKLEVGRQDVQLDSAYLQAFSAAQLDRMHKLVGSKGMMYGYR